MHTQYTNTNTENTLWLLRLLSGTWAWAHSTDVCWFVVVVVAAVIAVWALGDWWMRILHTEWIPSKWIFKIREIDVCMRSRFATYEIQHQWWFSAILYHIYVYNLVIFVPILIFQSASYFLWFDSLRFHLNSIRKKWLSLLINYESICQKWWINCNTHLKLQPQSNQNAEQAKNDE